MEAIFTRRSIRRTKLELLRRELIERVIETGRVAPSGGDCQTTRFIAIIKPSILSELTARVQDEFAQMEAGSDTYVFIANSINASKTNY